MRPDDGADRELSDRILELLAEVIDLPEQQWDTVLRQRFEVHPELEAPFRRLRERMGDDPARSLPVDFSAIDAEALPLPEAIGKYRPEAVLGSGGMGVVYRARPIAGGDPVAIKVLPHALRTHTGLRERLRREVLALARLRHPHVVPVVELGECEDGSPFLVMPWIAGRNLEFRLRSGDGPPRPEELRRRLALIERVAEALAHAHDAGIVHRDVKPSNILVTDDEAPYLADFGVASIQGAPQLTATGTAPGSPPYMAPEQLRGEAAGPEVDVYGLGATLYHCITGRVPYADVPLAAMAEHKRQSGPVPLRRLNEDVPGDVETICNKAMEQHAADRYPDVRAFQVDLRRFLDLKSIRARPPTATQRARRWVTRHRTTVLLLTAGILFVAVLATALRQNQDLAVAASRSAADSHFAHARLEAQRGNHASALELAELALSTGASDPLAVQILRIEVLERDGRSTEAIEALTQCLARGGESAHSAKLELMRCYFHSGFDFASRREVERIRPRLAELDPADRAFAEALLASELQESFEHAARCLELDPFHALGADLYTSLALLTGRVNVALQRARDDLRRIPRDSAARFRAALFVALAGDPETAQSIGSESDFGPFEQRALDFGIRSATLFRAVEVELRRELLGGEGRDLEPMVLELVGQAGELLVLAQAAPQPTLFLRPTRAVFDFATADLGPVLLRFALPFERLPLTRALDRLGESSGEPLWPFMAGLIHRWSGDWRAAEACLARSLEQVDSAVVQITTRRLFHLDTCIQGVAVGGSLAETYRDRGRTTLRDLLEATEDDPRVHRHLGLQAIRLRDPELSMRAALRWRDAATDDPAAERALRAAVQQLARRPN